VVKTGKGGKAILKRPVYRVRLHLGGLTKFNRGRIEIKTGSSRRHNNQGKKKGDNLGSRQKGKEGGKEGGKR